mmetsp:Transcript_41289/g.81492  ORF Transcript_41289/g.81492 Transcript_41289/m.81492 type:complete len:152 (-) Transcript_41289:855-1310(-)
MYCPWTADISSSCCCFICGLLAEHKAAAPAMQLTSIGLNSRADISGEAEEAGEAGGALETAAGASRRCPGEGRRVWEGADDECRSGEVSRFLEGTGDTNRHGEGSRIWEGAGDKARLGGTAKRRQLSSLGRKLHGPSGCRSLGLLCIISVI